MLVKKLLNTSTNFIYLYYYRMSLQPPPDPLLNEEDRKEYQKIKSLVGCKHLKPSITTIQNNGRFTKRMCNLLFNLADLSKLENGIYYIIEKYVGNSKCGYCKLIIFPPLSSGDFCNEDCYENRYITIFSVIYSDPKYQKYWDNVRYDSWLILESPGRKKFELEPIDDLKERSMFREERLNAYLTNENRISVTNARYSGFGTRGSCWSHDCPECGPAPKGWKFEKLKDFIDFFTEQSLQTI